MKKLIAFLVAAIITGAVLAQSTGVNGGGPNGGGGGASPGGATNAVQYNAGGGNLGGVSLAADQALMGAAGTPLATALINCGDATHALAYSTSTHTYSCQAITAGGGGGTLIVKAVSTSRNNTTTVTLDPELQFAASAATHTISCYLVISATTTPGGFRVTLSSTGTLAGNSWWNVMAKADPGGAGPGPGPLPATNNWNVNSGDAASPGTNDTASWIVQGSATTTTSGTIGVSWAQATSTGQNTTLNPGSYCNFT